MFKKIIIFNLFLICMTFGFAQSPPAQEREWE